MASVRLRVLTVLTFIASGSGAGSKGPILSFSGDAEEPIDMFGEAQAATDQDEEEEEDGEGEGEDGEPEDDFNAAWEVLDLARAIYEKQSDETGDHEVKLKLADTYIALGDVSLETGKHASPLYILLLNSWSREI